MVRYGCLLVSALAACGGSGGGVVLPPQPAIDLAPRGAGWAGARNDQLDVVSNNGAGYTGEIDVYELFMPSPGRLQVSLSWDHDADFDLILAGDAEGLVRLAEGITAGREPEYLGITVAGGQRVYALVAGWEGEPGPYEIETALLPPGAPVFAVETEGGNAPASNRPMAFSFNVELDPDQDVAARLAFVGDGREAEGTWCILGPVLQFHPRLPRAPGDSGGLAPGATYTLQFPRAARGLRAVTGEYLTDLVTLEFTAGPPVDPTPGTPPRVTSVSPAPGATWDGAPISVNLSKAVDPRTLTPLFVQVASDGSATPLAIVFTLDQGSDCEGKTHATLLVALDEPPAPGGTFRLLLPGTILALGGDGAPSSGLTGPAPQPGGEGFVAEFRTP